MADRVFFCPGMAPDVVQGMPVPSQMVDDLLAVSQIPAEQIEAVAAAVEAEFGFLGEDELVHLVSGIVGNETLASSVVRCLYNVQTQQLGQTTKVLDGWRRANQRNAEKFSDQALAELETKLPRLIKNYPVLSRSRKASRLRSVLGNAIQHIELICDARPVYNAARDSIEGLVPLTTMKIVYEGQDEETREVEVTLTREGVYELANSVQKAQMKLAVLERSVAEWIPNGLADSE